MRNNGAVLIKFKNCRPSEETMLAAVAITRIGLDKLKLPTVGRWEHAVAGGSVAVCGIAITLLGI